MTLWVNWSVSSGNIRVLFNVQSSISRIIFYSRSYTQSVVAFSINFSTDTKRSHKKMNFDETVAIPSDIFSNFQRRYQMLLPDDNTYNVRFQILT